MRVYINDKVQEAKAARLAEAFKRCVAADKTGQARHMVPMDLVGELVVAVLPPASGAQAHYALLAPQKGSEPVWHRSLQSAQRDARARTSAVKLPGYDVEVVWREREYDKPTVWHHGKLQDVDQIGNEWRRSARVLKADGTIHEVSVSDIRIGTQADVDEINNELTTIRMAKKAAEALEKQFTRLVPEGRGASPRGVLDRARLRSLARRQKRAKGKR
ncbi:MAG: hypothetical protein AB7W59_00350 [Acidimicrobiia bacterium]